jgi:hypothetical protein
MDSTNTAQASVIADLVSTTMSIRAASDILPQLGLHYVQALEGSDNGGGGSGTYFFGGGTMHTKAVLEM